MMSRVLFMFTCSYLVRGMTGTGSLLMSRIPDIVQELCPGANVCQDNYTTPAGLKSCCTDCSCSSDCEESGNCCFPNTLSTNDTDDSSSKRDEARSSECMYPMARQPEGEDRIHYQSYYMISSVQEYVQDDEKFISNISCGHENVAPWGSLYPVYSAQNKRIYKNMVCAAADGVTDGELWDAILECKKTSQGISSYDYLTDSDLFTDICTINFVYRGSSEDIQPLKCYSDLIDICPVPDFEIPDKTNVTKKDVIELCRSGFVSPYIAEEMYANVFCHICNGQYFSERRLCRQENTIRRGEPNNNLFIGLIDSRYITRDRSKTNIRKAEVPVACKNDGCRAIFCPSGQLRSEAGECVYLSTVWYEQEYIINIRLKMDISIDVSDVFQITTNAFTSKLPDFVSPWPNDWYTDSVFYELVEGGQSTTSFLVTLRNKVTTVNPVHFVQIIRNAITKKWLLKTNNVTLVLKSTFMPFKAEHNVDGSIFAFLTDHFDSLSLHVYRLIYRRYNFRKNELLITKLYLCKQVELIQSEFILSPNEEILYNNMTKQFLLNSEFTPVSSSRVRVCIEDSGLIITESSIASGANGLSELVLVLYVAASLLSLE